MNGQVKPLTTPRVSGVIMKEPANALITPRFSGVPGDVRVLHFEAPAAWLGRSAPRIKRRMGWMRHLPALKRGVIREDIL